MTDQHSVRARACDVQDQMRAMVTSHFVSQIVRAAVDLSLADHLAGEALTAAQVAEREGSAPDTTFRFMRACVAVGLLTADTHNRFASTSLLETLRKDTPGSLRGLALATTLPAQWLSWNEFTASVRTGHSQASVALGMDFFDYLERHPSQARDFSAGLSSTTSLWAADVAKAINTTGVTLAVDVGGATGSLLQLLQEANPTLHGIVFDRPNIADDAAAQIAQRGFPDRTDVVGGDFFESVPPADLYLLKFILHDWDDQRAIKILQRCREAMAPGGRIAIVEMVLGDLDDPGLGALIDMNMLAASPGRERSLDEYDALLAAAGLRRTAVLATSSPQSIIVGVVAPADHGPATTSPSKSIVGLG
jgi:O-methyltransferase domain/Dimerisation domain